MSKRGRSDRLEAYPTARYFRRAKGDYPRTRFTNLVPYVLYSKYKMSQPHRMHLKGPWNYRWLTEADSNATPDRPEVLLEDDRIKMPASWQDAFGAARGRVEFSRRFQKPTNLDEEEQVHIAFDGVGGSAIIRLNDERIGELADVNATESIDVTQRLKPSNVLSVEIEFTDSEEPGGLWAPVAIEIHNAVAWE